ncbi:hypothetical protein BDB00DRAFT_823083 [Zychaea mexicana]|uniref:uncharacterized protein n=1 Tax=Zychaea mexicana TaxID=64656 RepID=UPI0022FE7589|nr:uncharacterized protein BDB00DRAFT_823083 [Zychaea mexicana]KAI9493436.1 hypothetical protein BDB00DRAFT_823083 [Zychaea mexicana]
MTTTATLKNVLLAGRQGYRAIAVAIKLLLVLLWLASKENKTCTETARNLVLRPAIYCTWCFLFEYRLFNYVSLSTI